MYANVRFKTDYSKWDGHNAEDLRGQIILDINDYLHSGECPEECEPEYRKTLRKLQTEFDPKNLRNLIQQYYFEFFDSIQFWDGNPEKATGDDFSIYQEVLGLYK